jgi:hypothetical protein
MSGFMLAMTPMMRQSIGITPGSCAISDNSGIEDWHTRWDINSPNFMNDFFRESESCILHSTFSEKTINFLLDENIKLEDKITAVQGLIEPH